LDSEKNKAKARGYIYQRSGEFWYTCHNCGISRTFTRFLKEVDSGLYEAYRRELYLDEVLQTEPYEEARQKTLDNKALIELKCVSQLMKTHPARKFIEDRKLPKEFQNELFYCPEFKAWTNSQIPDKLGEKAPEEDRIIIPLYDSSKIMFGYQGRSLAPLDGKSQLRYISIILDETKPKIWGLHRVNFNRPYFTFEGPFDAMFLDNSIATSGGKITAELLKIGCDLENSITCYDNERYNDHVRNNIRKAVMNNYKVVIWPSNFLYKDINEMAIAGYTSEKIQHLLDTYTFQGLRAQLEFARWIS